MNLLPAIVVPVDLVKKVRCHHAVLWADIFNLQDENGDTRTNQQIADKFGVSKDTISSWICFLVDKQYIRMWLANNKRHLFAGDFTNE